MATVRPRSALKSSRTQRRARTVKKNTAEPANLSLSQHTRPATGSRMGYWRK